MRAEPIRPDGDARSLLAEAGLPVSDLSSTPGLHLMGLREGGRLVAVIGVEAHGSVGLLRSLAVTPGRRRSGLGLRLVADAEAWSAGHGIGTLYLLTATAASYFARLGYEATSRSDAPAAIAATAQFSGLCPASSTLMRKGLSAGARSGPAPGEA